MLGLGNPEIRGMGFTASKFFRVNGEIDVHTEHVLKDVLSARERKRSI